LASTLKDIRVCFVGDSYVAGAGDSSGLGWVGRLSGHAHASGLPLTVYNLGVRGDTSADVAARLPQEVTRRANPATQTAVVLAYGLNDVVQRMDPEQSVAATSRSLAWLGSARVPAMLVGPPAIGDSELDPRTRELDRSLGDCAGSCGVAYVSLFGSLAGDRVWLAEVRAGDGAHPGPGGYQRYFEIVRDPLTSFLAELTGRDGEAAR
jgi:acyl-CoA thioesterase I